MEPFKTHTGLVVPLDRINVDTDQMVPKQFLGWLTREGIGRILFYDWRYLEGERPNPEFVLNQPRYKGASILLGRANFGCGSSREHAAWAALDYGFRVIIAPSFADIFYSNCLKNGILPIRLPEAQIDLLFQHTANNDGYRLAVDLDKQTIKEAGPSREGGLNISFEMDPFQRECLMKGLDDIRITLRFEDKIIDYEKRHNPTLQLHGSLPSSS
jgi:3-isopropylmalate/(R)-2-methylmalate dehydratase small subunit